MKAVNARRNIRRIAPGLGETVVHRPPSPQDRHVPQRRYLVGDPLDLVGTDPLEVACTALTILTQPAGIAHRWSKSSSTTWIDRHPPVGRQTNMLGDHV